MQTAVFVSNVDGAHGSQNSQGKARGERWSHSARRFQNQLWGTTASGWRTIGENFMRLLVVTLCCFVAPPIVRADPTEDAAIKVIKQLAGRSNRTVKSLIFPTRR